MGVWVRRIAVLAASSALVACGSAEPSGGSAGALDGNGTRDGDARRGVERLAPGAAIASCGSRPPGASVSLDAWLWELTPGGQTPLAGVTVSVDTCDAAAMTDALGGASVRAPRGVPVVPRFRAPGHVTTIVSESVLDADSIVTDVLAPLGDAAFIPSYAPDAPSFALFVVAIGRGACADPSGVTVMVDGRPDARALYMASAWPAATAPTSDAGTTESGVVFFTGLAGGDRVTASGIKPGCSVRTVAAEQTGAFVLEDGAWTVGNVYVDDP